MSKHFGIDKISAELEERNDTMNKVRLLKMCGNKQEKNRKTMLYFRGVKLCRHAGKSLLSSQRKDKTQSMTGMNDPLTFITAAACRRTRGGKKQKQSLHQAGRNI